MEAHQTVHDVATMTRVAFSDGLLGLLIPNISAADVRFLPLRRMANGILIPCVMSTSACCYSSFTPAAVRYALIPVVLSIDSKGLYQCALAVVCVVYILIKAQCLVHNQ